MSTTPNLAAWEISGSDAITFLHGQTCNDIANLPVGQWQINAYLNIKGRVVALFWLKRGSEDALTALVHVDLAEAVFQRLKMFVMRSDVTISPSSADISSLYRDAATQLLGSSNDIEQQLIQKGIPSPVWINTSTSDKFLPQMLNLDLVGGLSFKKGCYPGQEIVARTAHRGRLKQRLVKFETNAASGDAIALEDGSSAGTIIAAHNGLAVAVTRLEHLEASFDNAVITDLPYSLI